MNPYMVLVIKFVGAFYTGAVTYAAAYGHQDWYMVIAAGLTPALGYLVGLADSQPAPWHKP